MANLDYLYNPDAVKDKFDRNYFVDKKLGFSVIERGTVLPHKNTAPPGQWSWGAGGIVDSQGEYIKGSHVASSVGESYTPPPTASGTAPKRSSILGCLTTYGDTL